MKKPPAANPVRSGVTASGIVSMPVGASLTFAITFVVGTLVTISVAPKLSV